MRRLNEGDGIDGVDGIEYGNPDNIIEGDGSPRDLKGYNEVALRSEVVIYVAIGDLDKFALVKDETP